MKEHVDNPNGFRGFTLVEMLVVISILLLLIAVALPAFTGVVLAVHVGQSQSIINQLDSAVKQYQVDFSSTPNSPGGSSDGLPQSNYVDPTTGFTFYGCQSLVLLLTGYHVDANNNTAYGWHPNRNSPTYGPYNDTEKLKVLPGCANLVSSTTRTLPNVTYKGVNYGSANIPFLNDTYGYMADSGGHTAHPVFLDAFGSVILYYSSTKPGVYPLHAGDNLLADNYCTDPIHTEDINGTVYGGGTYYTREDQDWSGTSHTSHTDPNQLTTSSGIYTNLWALFTPPPLSYYQNASNVYYRSDFMLMSWGGSRNWYSGSPQIKDNASNLYGK